MKRSTLCAATCLALLLFGGLLIPAGNILVACLWLGAFTVTMAGAALPDSTKRPGAGVSACRRDPAESSR
jgi:hypothetical protein